MRKLYRTKGIWVEMTGFRHVLRKLDNFILQNVGE